MNRCPGKMRRETRRSNNRKSNSSCRPAKEDNKDVTPKVVTSDDVIALLRKIAYQEV